MINHFEDNLDNIYPRLVINPKKIASNIKTVKKYLKEGQTLTLVTKVVAGEYELVKAVYDECQNQNINLKSFADSHISNLKKYQDIKVEKWLIREPMKNEIKDLIKYVDATFVCELDTLKWIDLEAFKAKKKQKVILTYELGDIREGINEKALYELIEETKKLENIEIYGLAANLADYGGAVPTKKNYKEFIDLCRKVEKDFGFELKVKTLPNSSGIRMILNGQTDKEINNIRLGECLWVGTDPSVPYEKCELEEFSQEGFILEAQIVEVQEKHLHPIGKNLDNISYVKNPIRKKALIAIGKEDVNIDELRPIDTQIDVLGGSSDYSICDITKCSKEYKVGDVLKFKISYFSLLKCMNVEYVYKEFLH